SPFQDAYETGKKHLMADRAGLAIVYFEQSLAIDPFSVAALNAIGAAYDQLFRFEIAKLYYMRALDIEPNGADTLNNMATSAAMPAIEKLQPSFGRAPSVLRLTIRSSAVICGWRTRLCQRVIAKKQTMIARASSARESLN